MRNYSCISPRFWIGKTGRELRGNSDAQLVAFYLMTCPTSEMHGVFYCPLSSIVHEIGFDKGHRSPIEGASKGHQRVIEALSVLQNAGFLVYDQENEFVFVKEFAKWQISETLKAGDKRIVSIKTAVETMPEPLRTMFINRYNEPFCLGFETRQVEGASKPLASPIEAPYKPLRSQEQEQGQEQEGYMQTAEPSAPSHLTSQIVDLYNEIASGHFPQMKVLTDKRKKAVKRFADFLRKQTKSADDDALLSEAKSYFLRASRCDFLCGKNDRGWKADFDFLVNENKAVLVLEGKYDNSTTEKHEEPSIHKVKNPGPPPSKDDDGWKAQEAYFRRIGMFKGFAS